MKVDGSNHLAARQALRMALQLGLCYNPEKDVSQ
jgi:hypothetical protein